MEKEVFAQRLIAFRKKKGYTQQQLAERLNVTNKAVSRWETAEGYPDITLLKPLCEALGISCDTLLSENEDFADIEKKDIQRYLPYIVALVSFILYFLLNKIGVPLLFSFLLMCCGCMGSIYLMIHHTDKQYLLVLLKFICVLLYVPVQGILAFLYMLKKISEVMQISVLSLLGMQATVEDFNGGMTNTMYGDPSLLQPIVIAYLLALLVVIILYIVLRSYFKKRYALTYKKLSLLPIKPFQKQIEKRYGIFTQITTVVCFLSVAALMLWIYSDIMRMDITQLNWADARYEEILTISMPRLQMAKNIMYVILAIGGIITLIGWLKASHKLWYRLDASILVLLFFFVLLTTIEKGIYVKAPLWIGILIVCDLLYAGYVIRKQRKLQST